MIKERKFFKYFMGYDEFKKKIIFYLRFNSVNEINTLYIVIFISMLHFRVKKINNL